MVKHIINSILLKFNLQIRRLNSWERSDQEFLVNCKTADMVTYEHGRLKIDAPAISSRFIYLIDEIFRQEIYYFNTDVEGPVCIDAGANVGCATIYFKRLYPNARVISIEADEYLFNMLEKNIARLKLSNVDLVNKALWVDDKGVNFSTDGATAGHVDIRGLGKGISSGITIPSITLTELLEQYEKVDFLKLDVEGVEWEIIPKFEDEIKKCSRIFVEIHFSETMSEFTDILNIFRDFGFTLRYLSSPSISRPFAIGESQFGPWAGCVNAFFEKSGLAQR